MTLNQTLISATTLPTSSASVTIPVPSGYTDLRLVASVRSDNNYAGNIDAGGFMQFNSATSGYTSKDLYGSGAGVGFSTNPYGITSAIFLGATNSSASTANTYSNKEIYIPNYTGSQAKSASISSAMETNATTAYVELIDASSGVTSAITSITFSALSVGNYAAGSSFTLYGITKLGVEPTVYPKATGGDIVKNDGTYWYHAFLSTGAFVPQQSLSCDYLVVAGGGTGGYNLGGGGGAGGVRLSSGQSVSATSYTVAVGAGGAGGFSVSNGSDSSFNSFVSTGGGYGAGTTSTNTANSGGSGGGGFHAAGYTTGGASSPVTSPVQGYAGGNGYYAGGPAAFEGGGGGAGGVGGNASNGAGGNGGPGTNAYATDWTSKVGLGISGYIAGGGGGAVNSTGTAGTGGSGGGGNGGTGTSTPATDGSRNTGSGGGGGNNKQSAPAQDYSGSGGSGFVIIRYAMA